MPANYETMTNPMAGGRERLGDRRFQPCACATTTSGSVALISWVARSLARMTRHNHADAAEDQAVESARSRELFMSVSSLHGPGEANHRDSVMTSHLPGGKPGSVATDIGSLDMACRARPPPGRLPPAGPAGRGRGQLHPHLLDQPVRRVLAQLIRNSPAPGTLPAALPALPPRQAALHEMSMQVTRGAADDRTPAAADELAAGAFVVRRCGA
jgi:hypothetical protein